MRRGSFCNAAGRCAMQIPQTTPGEGPAKVGDYVRVRAARWRVSDVRSYESCQLVTLTGIAPPDTGVERRVLTPFDTIELIDRPRRLRRVRLPLWRRAARALIAADTPPGGLRTIREAGIE